MFSTISHLEGRHLFQMVNLFLQYKSSQSSAAENPQYLGWIQFGKVEEEIGPQWICLLDES